MGFRDEGDAQRHKIDALERELEESRAHAETLRLERDQAVQAADDDDDEHDEGEGRRTSRSSHFAAGQAVYVEWNARWYDAHVTSVIVPRKQWMIHYDGWSNRWDEVVGAARIASRSAPRPGQAGGRGGGGLSLIVFGLGFVAVAIGLAYAVYSPSTPAGRGGESAGIVGTPGDTVTESRQLHPNRLVWIEWNGSWYPGAVIETRADGLVLVHYEGFSSDSDESVATSRVRLR